MTRTLRPRTWFELGGLVGATVVLIGFVLAAAGLALGGSLHPVTFVGLVGGAVALIAMMAVFELNIEVNESERLELRQLQWTHISYLTVAGAFYPAFVRQGLGLSGEWFVELPLAIVTALGWSMLVFLPAAGVYVALGAVPLDRGVIRDWLRLVGLFLLYGVGLGLFVGASRGVWYPLLGI